MTDSPTPLDGAIVRFLLRVIDRFEDTVSDPAALVAALKAVGLNESAVTQYQSFLTARASGVAKISSDLPKPLEVPDRIDQRQQIGIAALDEGLEAEASDAPVPDDPESLARPPEELA